MNPIDLILHFDQHLAMFISNYNLWVYAILFLIIFGETGFVVLPFLPGDSLLFIVGAFCARGELSVEIIVPLLIAAALIGDNCNYFVGRYLGHKLFSNPNSKIFSSRSPHSNACFFEKHGGKTLIVARFVPIMRTFVPFVAGMGEMPYLRFIAYSALGAFIWVVSLVFAGYMFGNLPFVSQNLTLIIFAIIGLSLLPLVIQAIKGVKTR